MGSDTTSILDACEEVIEEAIWEQDPGDGVSAFGALDEVVERLQALDLESDPALLMRRQGLVAMALMRTANLYRQAQDVEAAIRADEAALLAAETADDLSRGRCLLSMSGTLFASGDADGGMALLLKTREVFTPDGGSEHQQGLGWSWLLRADVINAGLVDEGPAEALAAASRALGILRSIDNWAGVARSYEAMATAEERLGAPDVAAALKDIAARYEARAGAEHQ